MKWKLFFIAQPQTDEEDNVTYEVGEYTVPRSKVTVMASEAGYDLFCYVTTDNTLANDAYTADEFIGVNSPQDILARVYLGLDNATTVNRVKYLLGAHWRSDGEWHFGNIHDWDDAGNPEPVWFGSYRKILGVEYD